MQRSLIELDRRSAEFSRGNAEPLPPTVGQPLHPDPEIARQLRPYERMRLAEEARQRGEHVLELPDAAAYQGGRPFSELKLDDVFSGLQPSTSGGVEASISDPAGSRLSIRFGEPFRECVVYTPPHREAICIEPYSCVAGAFAPHMQALDVGIRIVPPGGSFTAQVNYTVSAGA